MMFLQLMEAHLHIAFYNLIHPILTMCELATTTRPIPPDGSAALVLIAAIQSLPLSVPAQEMPLHGTLAPEMEFSPIPLYQLDKRNADAPDHPMANSSSIRSLQRQSVETLGRPSNRRYKYQTSATT